MSVITKTGKSGQRWQRNLLRSLCESEEGKDILKMSVMQAIDNSALYASELREHYDKLLGGYMPGWLNTLFTKAIDTQEKQMTESDMPERMYDICDEGEEDPWRHRRPSVFDLEEK